MLDRAKLLRAIAANHRSFFRRQGGAVEKLGGIELIVNREGGTIAFPVRRTRADVARIVDRARELRSARSPAGRSTRTRRSAPC